MPERTENYNGVMWAVVGIIVVAIVAWLLVGAMGGGPGVPNTGTDTANTGANTTGTY
jgi:hypothetical protein